MAYSDGARDVSRYYDFLYLWSQLTNRFRAFDCVGPHMIHRTRRDDATRRYSDRVIHRLIASAISDRRPVDALDAGCGYGGTCLDLLGWIPVTSTGMTRNEALEKTR